MILKYELQRQELCLSRFPYTPVLQLEYNQSRGSAYTTFVGLLSNYFRNVMDKSLSLEDINAEIYELVDKVKEEYPEDFPEVGYYTKNQLALLYQEGRLTYDGVIVYPIELEVRKFKHLEMIRTVKEAKEMLRQQKLAKEVAKARAYYELREASIEPIEVGNVSRSWDKLFEAFKDCIPERSNLLARKAIVREHIEISYVKGYWIVDKVLIEGTGKRYTMDDYSW